jgi:hypothetical protein
MRSKKPILTVIFPGIALLIVCLAPITAMTVRFPLVDDRLMFAALDAKTSVLHLSYLHSVEKTRVQGVFTADQDNRLLLIETRMESVGTGLPIEADECIGKKGSWRVAGVEPTVLPEFRFRCHKINNLHLEYNGKQIPVEFPRENALITLQVEKISVARYLFYRLSTMLRK